MVWIDQDVIDGPHCTTFKFMKFDPIFVFHSIFFCQQTPPATRTPVLKPTKTNNVCKKKTLTLFIAGIADFPVLENQQKAVSIRLCKSRPSEAKSCSVFISQRGFFAEAIPAHRQKILLLIKLP